MAAEDVKRYFSRAWENEAETSMSGPWRHDYITNAIAAMAGYCFMVIVTVCIFESYEYILLRDFPATAQRWCFVQPGETTTKLQRRRRDAIRGGVFGASMTRFVIEPLLSTPRGYVRRHWWGHEISSCVGMVIIMAVVLAFLLLTVAVCWLGDQVKEKTGWVSTGQCRLQGHCSLGSCSCSQYNHGESQHQTAFDMEGQAPRPSMVEDLSDAAPEQTHGLPPYGPGGVRLYGVRDHYSKHPYNPEMLGRACHTPYQERPGYTEYIRSLIESPVVEFRKLLSPVSDHVSIHHGANGTEAYHTITAQPAHRGESQEELRVKHYRQQQQEQVEKDTETGSIRSEATDDHGTAWLRARQFAASIFSESTSTAASRDSFGRSSMGMTQRGPLVNSEDGSNSFRETASFTKDNLRCKTYT